MALLHLPICGITLPSLNFICSHKMHPTLSSPTTLSLNSPAGFCGVNFGGESRQLWSPRAAGVGARKLSCTRASLGEEQRSNREPRLLHSVRNPMAMWCVNGRRIWWFSTMRQLVNLFIMGTDIACIELPHQVVEIVYLHLHNSMCYSPLLTIVGQDFDVNLREVFLKNDV